MTPEQIAKAREWLEPRDGWVKYLDDALDEIERLREEVIEVKDIANFHITEGTYSAFEINKLRAENALLKSVAEAAKCAPHGSNCARERYSHLQCDCDKLEISEALKALEHQGDKA